MKFEKVFRAGHKLYTSNHKILAQLIQGFTRFRYNCDIPVQTEIAPDTYFCHNAFEVVINPHAKIGAGAVVMKEVPDNCTAVGVPARIIFPAKE